MILTKRIASNSRYGGRPLRKARRGGIVSRDQPPRHTHTLTPCPLRSGADIVLTTLFPLKNLPWRTWSRRQEAGIASAPRYPNAKRFPVTQKVVEEQAPYLFPEAAGPPGLRLSACDIVVEQERRRQRKDGRQVFPAVVALKAVALVLQGKSRSVQRARPARCLSSLIGRSVTQRCFLPPLLPVKIHFEGACRSEELRTGSFSSVNFRRSADGALSIHQELMVAGLRSQAQV